VRVWSVIALVAASVALTLPVAAVELMTGDGYLLEVGKDDATRTEAESYASGALDALLVLNEVLASEGKGLFCLSEERSATLDGARLRAEFTAWLRLPAKNEVSGRATGELPLSALGWGFLADKFACPREQQPSAEPSTVRSLLRDSLRK
jgi:hypothetical protein